MRSLIIYIFLICPLLVFARNDDQLQLAKSYLSTGDVFYGKSQLDSSNYYYQKAADVYKSEAEKSNDTKIWESHIKCLYYLSWNLQLLSRFDQALKVSKPLLVTAQERLGIANSLTLKINDGIGVIYKGKTELALALKYHKEVLKIRLDSLGEKHRDVATSYTNIGIAYRILGNNELALESYLKALKLRKELFGENHILVGHSYNNAGLLYVQKRSYDLAIEYYTKALQIYQATSPKNLVSHASAYVNLSIGYHGKKDFQKALEYSNKALEIYTSTYGENHELVATTLSSIGNSLESEGQYELALSKYKRSLDIRKKLHGEYHFGIAYNYNNIGNIYKERKNASLALDFFQKATKVYRKVIGPKSTNMAISYINLGQVYSQKNEYKNAIINFQKAITANCINFNDSIDVYKNPLPENYFDLNILLISLHYKANAFSQTGNHKDLAFSLKTYELCDNIIDNIRNSHFKKSDQIEFGNEVAKIYNELIVLYHQLYEKEGDYKYLEKAFYYTEKSKAFVLFNSISENKAKQFSGIPDSLLTKEKEIKISKSFYQQKLLNSNDSILKIEYENKLFALNRSYENLIRTFENQYPKYFNLKLNPNIASITKIQNQINNNTIVVEYYLSDSSLYTFYIDKNNVTFKKLDLDLDLVTNITDINLSLKNGKVKAFANKAQKLYQLLFEESLFNEKTNTLILIPDGPLWYLSFDFLVTEKPKRFKFRDFQYLIHDYSISYSYSSNLLLQNNYKNPGKTKMECLAFSYGNDNNLNSGNQMSLRSFRNSNLIDLPGSRKEIAAVSQIMDGKYFFGTEANEKNFKNNAPDYAILHLALHGTIDEKDPMNSKLYFTQNASKSDQEITVKNTFEDEYLHAYELYNMSLSSEMVVLSACNTGSGKLEKGEGVMSLGRAFTYAGCKSMVISQWKLSDYSTPIIIESFYKHLDHGENKDQALRAAKLEYLENANNLSANPYLWASLVQIGDASPLPFSRKNWYLVLAAILILSIIGFLWKASKAKR